jgi:hypothetical protein
MSGFSLREYYRCSRRVRHTRAQRPDGIIEVLGEYPIAIMDQEPMHTFVPDQIAYSCEHLNEPRSPDALESALRGALSATGPTIIEAIVDASHYSETVYD